MGMIEDNVRILKSIEGIRTGGVEAVSKAFSRKDDKKLKELRKTRGDVEQRIKDTKGDIRDFSDDVSEFKKKLEVAKFNLSAQKNNLKNNTTELKKINSEIKTLEK